MANIEMTDAETFLQKLNEFLNKSNNSSDNELPEAEKLKFIISLAKTASQIVTDNNKSAELKIKAIFFLYTAQQLIKPIAAKYNYQLPTDTVHMEMMGETPIFSIKQPTSSKSDAPKFLPPNPTSH